VVGATANTIKGGYHIFNNLSTYYAGRVYPVNPNYDEINGHPVYPSLSALPEVVELAIIFTPARTIPDIVGECARLGIKRVQIQAAGFSEIGVEGEERTRAVLEIATKNGMRIWGPNCTGSVSSRDMFFGPFMPTPDMNEKLKPGPVSIIAQSGMMAAGYLLQVLDSGYFGIDKAAAIGNKIDIDEVDILRFLATEEHTKIILMYLEGIKRGKEFLSIAKTLKGKKALVLLKAGRNPKSAEAALSHTGTMAGSEDVISGALAQSGVARVFDFIEMAHVGRALALLPTWRGGKKIAVITITGGGGIVASDFIGDRNLSLAPLTEKTLTELATIYPPWMPPKNPVDIWPAMELRGINETLQRVVPLVLRDPSVDAALLLTFASPLVHQMDMSVFSAAMKQTQKPIVTWMFGLVPYFEDFKRVLEGVGIPVFLELPHTVSVLSALRDINR
jgi:acetyltransferase